MDVIAISGKGGVGKSTVSGVLATSSAKKGIKTAWVDCDKKYGRAVQRILSLGEGAVGQNCVYPIEGLENLYVGPPGCLLLIQ